MEIIVTLVILAIVAAGAMPLLTNVVKGMILARNEAAAEENIQAALLRITHEIANADTKRMATNWINNNVISYYYRDDVTISTIQLSGNTLQLNTNTLLENVVNGTGFVATKEDYIVSPAVPVKVNLVVRVPTVNGTVNKNYNIRIELNAQRFQ